MGSHRADSAAHAKSGVHRRKGCGNFLATDRVEPGNRERSQTRETSAWRKRSPSNKPLTSNHHASVRQGHSLWLQVEPVRHSHDAASACCKGGSLGPQLRKHGHCNGWRESTVFRQPSFFARSPSGHSRVLQTRFSPAWQRVSRDYSVLNDCNSPNIHRDLMVYLG